MKKCSKCKIDKPLSEFHISKESRDGHVNSCKECVKSYLAAYRLLNKEKLRVFDKIRNKTPSRIEQKALKMKRYIERFPERKRAQLLAQSAVRCGRLKKHCCHVCGDEKTEAHHSDYDRPLDVVWLCEAHHKQTHELARKLDRLHGASVSHGAEPSGAMSRADAT